MMFALFSGCWTEWGIGSEPETVRSAKATKSVEVVKVASFSWAREARGGRLCMKTTKPSRRPTSFASPSLNNPIVPACQPWATWRLVGLPHMAARRVRPRPCVCVCVCVCVCLCVCVFVCLCVCFWGAIL